jgi:glycosyltransferase involved in cell wall biosynthesis
MVIIDFIYDTTGGTENQVLLLLKNIDHSKYEIHLVCLHNTPWLREQFNIQHCVTKAFNYNVFNHADIGNLSSFGAVTRYIRRIKPDIVMTFFPTSYILGVLAARLAGVKNIVSTRRDHGLWLKKGILPLLKFANKFVKMIVTNAEAIKQLVVEEEGFDQNRIHVIYNGIDVKQFLYVYKPNNDIKATLRIPLKNFVIGLVAGLRPMKRHETFLKAAARVLKSRKDVHFILVGDGSTRAELEEMAKEFSIEKHIHFVGWQKDVRPFLSVMDIGLNCSANEGLSNAIMEYMACGVPCIISRAGGNEELIQHGENGYTFELDNADELASLIVDLLNNEQRRTHFALKARAAIEKNFSIEKMVSSYECLCSRLTSGTDGTSTMRSGEVA